MNSPLKPTCFGRVSTAYASECINTVSLSCARKKIRWIATARYSSPATCLRLGSINVQHIHADGALESHEQVLDRLLRQLDLPEKDIFRSRDDVMLDAYKLQEARIAYTVGKTESGAPAGSAAR